MASAALDDAVRASGRTSAAIARDLLRFVTVDADGSPAPRRVLRHRLPGAVSDGLNAFINQRLLTVDADHDGVVSVEVVHRGLLSWPPLSEAIESDRANLRLRSDLPRLATDWAEAWKDNSYLLSGSRLAAIDRWARDNAEELSPFEKEFLDASRAKGSSPLQRLFRNAPAGGWCVFISYRRAETLAVATTMRDLLAETLGDTRVFLDVASLVPGSDFRRELRSAIRRSRVMLVLIGKQWATMSDGKGRRIGNRADIVRQEVEEGLRRNLTIIPVLVDGATMPDRRDLPTSLEDLIWKQAMNFDSTSFHSAASALLRLVVKLVEPESG
jgi:TIR domain/Novel STAND NTPase 1